MPVMSPLRMMRWMCPQTSPYHAVIAPTFPTNRLAWIQFNLFLRNTKCGKTWNLPVYIVRRSHCLCGVTSVLRLVREWDSEMHSDSTHLLRHKDYDPHHTTEQVDLDAYSFVCILGFAGTGTLLSECCIDTACLTRYWMSLVSCRIVQATQEIDQTLRMNKTEATQACCSQMLSRPLLWSLRELFCPYKIPWGQLKDNSFWNEISYFWSPALNFCFCL